MQIVLLAGLLCTSLVVLRAASSTARQESPGAPALPPELKQLAAWVGTWDAETTMMGETTKGSETCRLECGGWWLVTEHTGTMMGAPFQGKGFTGYDAARGAFTGVWIDSSGGPMSVFTGGAFTKDGKTFEAQADGLDMSGKPAHFEYLSTFPDARTRTFEIYQLDGGKRELQMSIRYTKRG